MAGPHGDAGIRPPRAGVLGRRHIPLTPRRALGGGGGVRWMRVEATVHRPDRSFPIGVTTTTLDGPVGARPRVSAIFTDISDSKRLEQLHLRAERLEAVAQLSSSLAHEIKNPLASIR